MICVIGMVVFAVLGIFSAKYRSYAREAFSCVFRKIQLKACDTAFDQKMKSKIVAKLLTRNLTVAKFVNKHFEAISWVFTVLMIVSFAVSVHGIYNLSVHGTCDPKHPENCPFTSFVGNETCPAPLGMAVKSDEIKTFQMVEGEVCKEGGKPVIRMFSATWCPHCNWIKERFDKVVKEYVGRGEIVAYHWQLDLGDDVLTEEVEKGVPEREMEIFKRFSRGQIPTFVFGCKYYRIGNGYERERDLDAEEKEFRAVIERLLAGS